VLSSPSLRLELVSRLTVQIGEPIDAGRTPAGHRRIIPITGGTAEGPGFSGEVLPVGADWSLVRLDGVPTVTATYLVRTQDGTVLTVSNTGSIKLGEIVMGITRPSIEAPDGPYAWLNDAVLVGSLVPLYGGKNILGVTLEFHQVVPSHLTSENATTTPN
jgi:hypothetical protein